MLTLIGGGLIIASASVNSLIQEIVPDQLRGRVVSIWVFIFAGFAPVGALYAGTMARYTSPLQAYLFGGIACLLTILLISTRAKWLWKLQ